MLPELYIIKCLVELRIARVDTDCILLAYGCCSSVMSVLECSEMQCNLQTANNVVRIVRWCVHVDRVVIASICHIGVECWF